MLKLIRPLEDTHLEGKDKQPMNIQSNQFPLQIFRTYDIRGKETLLTAQVVAAIARAFVTLFQERGQTQIVLGYDARLTSPSYSQIFRTVLQPHFEVIEIGCCSTPQMYYAARQYQDNGIMITASHNPKTDNGIKWIVQGTSPTPALIQQVGLMAEALYDPTHPVMVSAESKVQFDATASVAYIETILDDIQLKRPLKVVLDGLNGSAGYSAELLLNLLHCDVTGLRCEANGHFPDHAPDPTKSAHLTGLRQQVLRSSADLGIALDGDGDRVVLVDENAKIISADQLLALMAQICLERLPGREVVFDVKCSTMVRQRIEQLGGKAKMIRTGSSFLRQYIAQSKGQAIFGGEYAGHYVFNDGRGLGYDDGLYAALRVMEYLSEFPNKTLSMLLAAYPDRYHTEDTYISTYHNDPQVVLAEISSLSRQYSAELSEIDGVRLDFEYGFGIIRASNTGEFFTVRFDADSPTHLDQIRHTFVTMLSDHYPKIAQDILNAH